MFFEILRIQMVVNLGHFKCCQSSAIHLISFLCTLMVKYIVSFVPLLWVLFFFTLWTCLTSLSDNILLCYLLRIKTIIWTSFSCKSDTTNSLYHFLYSKQQQHSQDRPFFSELPSYWVYPENMAGFLRHILHKISMPCVLNCLSIFRKQASNIWNCGKEKSTGLHCCSRPRQSV